MPPRTGYNGARLFLYYSEQHEVLKHLSSLSGTFHLIYFQLQLIVGEAMEKWANVHRENPCWQGTAQWRLKKLEWLVPVVLLNVAGSNS